MRGTAPETEEGGDKKDDKDKPKEKDKEKTPA